jgi:hypothetical protein
MGAVVLPSPIAAFGLVNVDGILAARGALPHVQCPAMISDRRDAG